MSTQDAGGVTFSIVPEEDHKSFRLLELPAELLELLVSDNPSTLQLKSAEGTPGHATDSTAALCTANKTYNLRQINHSNSVYITQTSTPRDEDALAPPGIDAIATSAFTMEITPASTTVSAIPYLKTLLPLYISANQIEPKDPVATKRQLFADVPLSEAECEDAWTRLTCFESLDHPTGCFRPSAKAKLVAWKSILTQATASGVDATAEIPVGRQELIIDGNEEWPVELSYAVLRSLCATATAVARPMTIEKAICVRQVGAWQLEVLAQGVGAIPRAELLAAWSDALPEKWRAGAGLDALTGLYNSPDGGRTVTLADDPADKAKASNASNSLGAKRKWHDKFRISKKTA